MAQPSITQPVLPANPNARVVLKIKRLVKDMRPKFDTIRSVTIGAIPVESNAVNELYGDYLELACLIATHPAFDV